MIPIKGCDPKLNVYVIGGLLLREISSGDSDIEHLMISMASSLGVSIDHIILSLDWLYMISAVDIDGDKVKINETR